jgi:hypothetical protein
MICPDALPLSKEKKEVIFGSTLTMGSSVLLWAGITLTGQPWIPSGAEPWERLFSGL